MRDLLSLLTETTKLPRRDPVRILEARKGIQFQDATLQQLTHVALSLKLFPVVFYDRQTQQIETLGDENFVTGTWNEYYIENLFIQKRRLRGESCNDVGKKVGISQKEYSNFEDVNNGKLDHMVRIARHFDLLHMYFIDPHDMPLRYATAKVKQ